MLRVLLFVLLVLFAIRAFGRLFSGVAQGARGPRRASPGPASAPVKMIKDPVCGTFVVPGKALSLSAGGATHWFCSERCRNQYASRA